MLKVVNEISKAKNVTVLMLRLGLKIVHDPGAQGLTLISRFAAQGGQGLEGPKPDLTPYNWVFAEELGLYQLFTPAGVFDRRRIEDSMGAMQTIARNFHGRSGRKNLIWFSRGFPMTVGQDPAGYDAQTLGGDTSPKGRADDLTVFAKDMDFTGRMLNNANVAVYPVDMRYMSLDDTKSSDRSTMQDLANETGGVAYLTRKDVAKAVGEALNDARTTYVLKYAITDLKFDGKFHQVKLETKRKDVKLRSRKGYYAPTQSR
jgi:VWFA-related protein